MDLGPAISFIIYCWGVIITANKYYLYLIILSIFSVTVIINYNNGIYILINCLSYQYCEWEKFMGFTKPCSHPLLPTPTHSNTTPTPNNVWSLNDVFLTFFNLYFPNSSWYYDKTWYKTNISPKRLWYCHETWYEHIHKKLQHSMLGQIYQVYQITRRPFNVF